MRAEPDADGRGAFLPPGGVLFQRGGTARTILGSCVSIVLLHRSEPLGGLCHFMLPFRPETARVDPAPDGRYADDAAALLFGAAEARGFPLREFRALVFGGGSSGFGSADPADRIGTRNVLAAERILARASLEPAAACVGGLGHRSLLLDLHDGRVDIGRPTPSGTTRIRSFKMSRTAHG